MTTLIFKQPYLSSLLINFLHKLINFTILYQYKLRQLIAAMQKQQRFLIGDRQLYEKWTIKRQKIVGRGNSYVYEVQDQQNNIQCVKQVKLEDNMSQFVFRKQVELLQKLKSRPHPHIVEFKGSYSLEYKNQFKSRKGYIQMEKGITNLKEFLQHRKEKKQFFNESEVLLFFISMLDAFAHLQRVELAHRDVKPSNILLFSLDPLFFKVCDVGAGTAVGVCDMTENRTVIGTPYYLSPELFMAYRQKQNLTNYKVYKSDCYSLGLVFLQFLTLQRLEERQRNQSEMIEQFILQAKKRYGNIVGIGKVLRRMLDQNIKTRMDFLELQSYICENQLLRNRIDPQLQLDPALVHKLTSQKEFFIETFEDMSNLSKIVGSGNKTPNLKIDLNSSNGFTSNNSRNIEQITNLRHLKLEKFDLNIQMCGLDSKQAEYIAQGIFKNSSIKSINLNLWNNEIKNQGFVAILNAIQTIIPNLEDLSINVANNAIRFNSALKGLFNLSQANNLKNFQLKIGFNEAEVQSFQCTLKQIAMAPKLEQLSLDFERMKLSYIHFNRAIKQLQTLKNLRIFSLNASNNDIREEGIFGISDLLEQMKQLVELSIILRSAQFSDKGFSEFMKSLCCNPSNNKIGYLKLNLLGNSISQKGIKSGLNTLQNLSDLKKIDLNFSKAQIEDFGIKWIGLALLNIKRLESVRLMLDFTKFTEKGCVYIGRMISQLDKLTNFEISLKENNIKLKGIQYICQGLLSCKKIKRLKIVLDQTKIGDYAANYLAGCLLKMRALQSVDLNMENCELSEGTVENITKLVRQCSNKAEEITISMRRNTEIKKQLYEQIKKQMSNSRVAVKVDNPNTLQYSKTSL